MANLTTHEELKDRILTLAGIEESPTPFVSCYLNLENGEKSVLQTIELRAELLRRILKGNDLVDFEESVSAIKSYVKRELLPEAKGMAFFARSCFEKRILHATAICRTFAKHAQSLSYTQHLQSD
jgi:hypothetical protein